jgi:hypothetical protein
MFLTVNEKGFIKNLESVFSDRSKVISEAIQNSRRAGASRVAITSSFNAEQPGLNTVVIQDDGHGITDFQKLLTVAESGWSKDIVDSDAPFGMGFVATLFAAKKIIIESNGQRIEWNTSEVLAGATMPPPSSVMPRRGTTLTMVGFDASADDIERWVAAAARAYPLPLTLNGVEVERPYALLNYREGREVIETEIGTLVLNTFNPYFDVVLQDHIVYSAPRGFRAPSDNTAVFYVNNSFKARMPDRDCLINEFEALEEIRAVLTRIQADRLQVIRQTFNDDKAFVDAHFEHIVTWDRKLLNSIDYLPAAAFDSCDYPTENTDLGFGNGSAKYCVAVEPNDSTMIIESDDSQLIGNIAAMFAYEYGAQVLAKGLDKDHWVHTMVRDLSPSEFTLQGDAKHTFAVSVSYNEMINDKANIGKFSITYKPLEITVEVSTSLVVKDEDTEATCQGLEGALFIDIDAYNADSIDMDSLLLQGWSYCDEYDCYMHDQLERDGLELRQLLQSVLSESPESYIQFMLKSIPNHIIEQMKNSPMRIEIDDQGAVCIAKAA